MQPPDSKRSAFAWPAPVWTLAIATLLGVISAWEHYSELGKEGQTSLGWAHAFEFRLPFWYLWALLAPVVAAIARWVPRRLLLVQLTLLLIMGIALSLFHAIFEHAIDRLFAPQFFPAAFWETYRSQIRWWLPNDLLLFSALVGITYATDLQTRYRERELAASRLGGQLAKAELHALRMQLNPHFLFNAMNSIAMLVRNGARDEAVKTIAGLSDLLRALLDEERPHEVPLREELDFLRRYLDIEHTRFGDRLQATITADDDALEAQVPSLVLQPIVENAIRHGIARRTAAGRLSVSAVKLGDRLVLQVTDDGPGLDRAGNANETGGNGAGVGLRNTQARLQQLYGDHQRFELKSGSGEGTVATIEIPFHITPLEVSR